MTIEQGGVAGCSLMPAAGWAWLDMRDRDHVAEVVRAFMDCARDGMCEMIEAMTGSPPGI